MRDNSKDCVYYDNYIASHNKLLERIRQEISSSGDDEERRKRFLLAKGNVVYNLMKASYSAGKSLEEVKKYFDELLDDMSEFWGNQSSILYMYDMMALAVLFGVDFEKFEILSNLTKLNDREDALTYLYESYMKNHLVIVRGRTTYGGPYESILSIVEKSEDAKKDLIKYLKKEWYIGNKQAFWYDAHKSKQDIYVGYWSFEAGAIAKILNIDDSSLKDEPYYPYDLVHFKDEGDDL